MVFVQRMGENNNYLHFRLIFIHEQVVSEKSREMLYSTGISTNIIQFLLTKPTNQQLQAESEYIHFSYLLNIQLVFHAALSHMKSLKIEKYYFSDVKEAEEKH